MLPRLRIGTLGGPPTGRRLERALNEAARLIRSHLDTQKVLRAAVEAAHPMLASRRTSAWLTTGKEPPRFAHAVAYDSNLDTIKAPSAVMEAAARKRAVLNDLTGRLAIPIVAPRAGSVGVLLLERSEWSAEARDFAERLAYETALALETAYLYERAVAEKEKSEAILARVGDAVVVTGARGRIAEWNRAAEQVFRTGSEAAVGRRCEEVLGLHRGEQALSCENGCPLLQDGRSDGPLGEEVWRGSEDGRRQPLLATAEAVRDPDGTVSDVVHSFRDITRLKEADEAKTLFLATASHELKTPLTVIQGFTQTLLDHEPEPELRRQALQMIERRAMELNEIVNRLLLSSRIEAGRLQLNLVEVEIPPLVTERVDAMRAATMHPLSLRIEPDASRVIADPSALAIVIDHLLDNASKYSPNGKGIGIEVRAREAIELIVADHGIGMDAEQKTRCFDKFWQAESTDVRRFGGTGIGLYIVRSLVEAMQGTVAVDSEMGVGSSFTVRLQRADVKAEVLETPPPQKQQQTAPQAGVGEQSVIREFMRQIGVPVRRER